MSNGNGKALATSSATTTKKGTSAKGRTQYMNEQCYARRSSANADGQKADARHIIGEILRLAEEYVRHLLADGRTPQPPVVLAGFEPEELLKWWSETEHAASKMKVERHHKDGSVTYPKQNIRTTILGTTVCSYPGPPDNDDPQYAAWKQLTVQWAKQHYGSHLAGVYEHRDEPHGHIHVVFANGGKNVKPLLAGHGAALKVMAAGGTKVQAKVALKAANRALQDEYQAAVGRHVELGRIGPNPQPKKSMKRLRAENLKRELDETNAMQLALKRALERADERERLAEGREQRAAKLEADAQAKAELIVAAAEARMRAKEKALDEKLAEAQTTHARDLEIRRAAIRRISQMVAVGMIDKGLAEELGLMLAGRTEPAKPTPTMKR